MLTTPTLDGRMISREEHIRHPQAPPLRGSGELRVPARIGAEGVPGQRVLVSQHPWNEAGHDVDQYHGRDLAAAQDIVPDRDLAVGNGLTNTVVHPLVAATDDDEAWLPGQAFGHALMQPLAPRLEQDYRP